MLNGTFHQPEFLLEPGALNRELLGESAPALELLIDSDVLLLVFSTDFFQLSLPLMRGL